MNILEVGMLAKTLRNEVGDEIVVLPDCINVGRYKIVVMQLPYGHMVINQSEAEMLRFVDGYKLIAAV